MGNSWKAGIKEIHNTPLPELHSDHDPPEDPHNHVVRRVRTASRSGQKQNARSPEARESPATPTTFTSPLQWDAASIAVLRKRESFRLGLRP